MIACTVAPVAKRSTLSSRTNKLSAFSPKSKAVVSRKSFAVQAKVGIFFSTTTGNTEEVADLLSGEVSGAEDPVDIGDVEDLNELTEFSALVVGAPTWNTGADENRSGTSWDDVLEGISGLDMSGTKVAVFGCGDSSSYTDYFCDAIEEVHRTFSEAGATMVGEWPCSDYEFEESKSVVGGAASSEDAEKLLGLAIDVENQSDLTEERVSAWAAQINGEMGL